MHNACNCISNSQSEQICYVL